MPRQRLPTRPRPPNSRRSGTRRLAARNRRARGFAPAQGAHGQPREPQIREHNGRCELQFSTNAERQAEELRAYQQSNAGIPFRFKPPPDLLNLRSRQEALVRQKKYTEADRIRAEADIREQLEVAVQQEDYQFKVALAVEKMQQRHHREAEALQERLQRSRNELLRERDRELEKLLHRYTSTKVALDKQHALEARQLDQKMKASSRPVCMRRDLDPQGSPADHPASLRPVLMPLFCYRRASARR